MRAFDRDLIRGGHYGQRPSCAALTGRTHGCTDQCCKREESSCQLGAVHTWPIADIPSCTAHVCFRGKADMTVCGKSAFAVAIGAKRTWPIAVQVSAFDPKRT